jgi:hypothetical protein
MLDYILELTNKILLELNKLSTKDKDLIQNQVSFALEQTRAHINYTRQNGTDKSSTILSNIWQRTANNIKHINNPSVKQLVNTIKEKGKYWSDPDSYDTEQFEKHNMRITQVDSILKEMCK